MSTVLKLLSSVVGSLFWSFLAKPILMRLVWGLLALAAKQTDNPLDDELVRMAKARYEGRSQQELSEQKGWHFDKTLSITHIISTSMIAISIIWWGAGIDKRIAHNTQQIEHLQLVQQRNREESRLYDQETRQALEKISHKLDRIIERTQING